jgi:hypothetical protein
MINIACLNLGDAHIKLNELDLAKYYLKKVNGNNMNIAGIITEVTRLLNEIANIERG